MPRAMDSQDKADSSKDTAEAGAPVKETVFGGEEMSCDKTDSGDKTDANELKALTMGNRAASMFNSAVKETIKIKKMDTREKYAFYLRTCYIVLELNSCVIGPSKTFTMGRLISCGASWPTPVGLRHS
jgi:hypothetical protein